MGRPKHNLNLTDEQRDEVEARIEALKKKAEKEEDLFPEPFRGKRLTGKSLSGGNVWRLLFDSNVPAISPRPFDNLDWAGQW